MIVEILLISVSLAMDAFAVSIGKGLTTHKNTLKVALVCGVWFGAFQAIMPVVGFAFGSTVSAFIQQFSGPIALMLLAFVGINMIREAVSNKDEEVTNSLDAKEMFMLSIATSIDALVVGISYVALQVNIIIASAIIGVITFIICFAGALIGNRIGSKWEIPSAIAGGIVLIIIGLKVCLVG